MRLWARLFILTILGASLAWGQTKTPETVAPATTPEAKPPVAVAKPVDVLLRCRSILDDAVNDHNPDVRKGAAEALSLVGVKDVATDLLPPMLDDRDVTVRVAVISTLADLTENKTFVLPLLNKALSDPVPEVDFAAAKVLYQLHDPDATEYLLEVVSKESKASSGYLTKEKRSALRLLHTPTRLFTTMAIGAAGFAPVPGLGFGLSSAQGILSDPDSSARAATLLLVGNSTDPGLAEVVRAAFTDKEWSVRAAAAHVVAMHPFPEMRESLVPLLDDKKEAVQVRAAAAYIRLDHATKTLPAKPPSTVHHIPNKPAASVAHP